MVPLGPRLLSVDPFLRISFLKASVWVYPPPQDMQQGDFLDQTGDLRRESCPAIL